MAEWLTFAIQILRGKRITANLRQARATQLVLGYDNLLCEILFQREKNVFKK